jgi:hypothetical protein
MDKSLPSALSHLSVSGVVLEAKNIVLTPFSITMRSQGCSSEADRGKIIHWKLAVWVKVKAAPLQAWTGPGGSRRSRLPDFTTVGT